MFNVLKDWEFLGLDTKTLEIARSNQSFSASYFDDKDRHEQLSAFCREFFKKDVRVNIVTQNRPQSKKKKISGSKPRHRPESAGHSDLPGPVQDIIQVFQGEIKKD